MEGRPRINFIQGDKLGNCTFIREVEPLICPSGSIARKAEFKSLVEFHDFVEQTCKQRSEISEQVVYDLQLAVDEACINVIVHGYAGMTPGTIPWR